MLQVAEAVHYFGKAGSNNHGVRLAKQHGMDAELLDLALKARLHLPPPAHSHVLNPPPVPGSSTE